MRAIPIPIFLLGMSLAQAQLPIITNQPVNRIVWAGGNLTLTVGVSNASAFTYQWQLNNTNLSVPIITTLVGGGVGDNGPATDASLRFPFALARDGSGNLFIADYNNNRIRKVDTHGSITTVAGDGFAGFSGDGGPAINARMDLNDRNGFVILRGGMAVDKAGNLFIADTGNQRIRRIDTNSIITTFAGNGSGGFSGDGGPATDASFTFPADVVADQYGNVFISDTQNGRIRKVDTNGVITTVAGNGDRSYSNDGGPATNAALYFPAGVALDAMGDLFIADCINNRVRMVDTNGIITTVAGNGSSTYSGDNSWATNAGLSSPIGVAIDGPGNLLVADAGNSRVRKVNAATGIITLVAGTGTNAFSGDGGLATNASLNLPAGIAADTSGNIYIADANNFRVRRVDNSGVITTFAGNGRQSYCGDGGSATNAALLDPFGAAVDVSGNIFIADTDNDVIRKVDTNGIISTVAGNGIHGFSGDRGPATNAKLAGPYGVGLDAGGNILIAERDGNRIRKVDTNGVITTIAGNGTYGSTGNGGRATNAMVAHPTGVTADALGNVFLAESGGCQIRKVDTNGIISTVAGLISNSGSSGDGGFATNAAVGIPFGLAFDPAGNLFIAEEIGYRIRKVDTNGIIITVAGNGGFAYNGDDRPAVTAFLQDPRGVAIDAAGNLYIADSENHRIRKVDTNGMISTLAGNGVSAWSGDGGPSANAAISTANGVALDRLDNVLIADTGNQRIRKVDFTGRPLLPLPNVGAANAGSYQVIVSGEGGSVTSSVVNLMVTDVPLIYQASRVSDGRLMLNFVTRTNSINEVLSTTNLVPPVIWESLSTNLAGPDGTWQFIDTNTMGCPTKFYRSLTHNEE